MRYRVPVKFVIHGAVDVSAPDDASMDELFRLADYKSGDVADRMASHSAGGRASAETFPARSMKDVLIVRNRR